MMSPKHAETYRSPTAEAPRGRTVGSTQSGITADRLLLGEESERIVKALAWLLLVVRSGSVSEVCRCARNQTRAGVSAVESGSLLATTRTVAQGARPTTEDRGVPHSNLGLAISRCAQALWLTPLYMLPEARERCRRQRLGGLAARHVAVDAARDPELSEASTTPPVGPQRNFLSFNCLC
jgi:hypothetical protein